MGHSHGTKWTDEALKVAVCNMVTILELERMPSRSEMDEYFGNTSVTNKLAKSGGIYHHAKIWGLPIKNSETSFGLKYEKMVLENLRELGFSNVMLTSMKHPYDILVDGRVKIDVKVGRKVKSGAADYFTFNLEKKMQTCDIYVALALGEYDELIKTYIIPSSIMSGKKQLSLGINHSQYEKYVGRWDYITMYNNAFSKIELN